MGGPIDALAPSQLSPLQPSGCEASSSRRELAGEGAGAPPLKTAI